MGNNYFKQQVSKHFKECSHIKYVKLARETIIDDQPKCKKDSFKTPSYKDLINSRWKAQKDMETLNDYKMMLNKFLYPNKYFKDVEEAKDK